MSIGFRPHPSGGVVRLSPLFVALVLALWAGTSWAVNVDCSVPGSSIQAVLDGLDKDSPQSVTITGTCVEAVVVDGFKDLVLSKHPVLPGDAVIQRPGTYPDPWSALPAVQITGSKVSLSGLTFQEDTGTIAYAAPLVRISRGRVWMEKCTIWGSHGGGLAVEDHSSVDMVATTIQNNSGTGIGASGNSVVTVSLYTNWYEADLTLVQGNATGITANYDAYVAVGHATIQANTQGAVATHGGYIEPGEWSDREGPTVTDNGAMWMPAVSAGFGGEIWLIARASIRDNRFTGAEASVGGELVVCCAEGTVISGNAGYGVSAFMGGGVYFWGPAVIEHNMWGGVSLDGAHAWVTADVPIRENGDPGDPNSFGGLVLARSSAAGGIWNVADNYGPGVMAATGASVAVDPTSVITRNKGYGVSLEANATATFADGATVTGNKGFDLVCTSGSVAGTSKGMKPNIGRMKCPDWAQLTPPPAWATTSAAAASAMTKRSRPR